MEKRLRQRERAWQEVGYLELELSLMNVKMTCEERMSNTLIQKYLSVFPRFIEVFSIPTLTAIIFSSSCYYRQPSRTFPSSPSIEQIRIYIHTYRWPRSLPSDYDTVRETIRVDRYSSSNGIEFQMKIYSNRSSTSASFEWRKSLLTRSIQSTCLPPHFKW